MENSDSIESLMKIIFLHLRSHVLRAISLDNKYAEGTIRISLSESNTIEDAQKKRKRL